MPAPAHRQPHALCRLFVRNSHFASFATDSTKISASAIYFDGINWTMFEALAADPGPVYIVWVVGGGRSRPPAAHAQDQPCADGHTRASNAGTWLRLACNLSSIPNSSAARLSGRPRCPLALCRISGGGYIDLRWQRQLAGGELGKCHDGGCIPKCLAHLQHATHAVPDVIWRQCPRVEGVARRLPSRLLCTAVYSCNTVLCIRIILPGSCTAAFDFSQTSIPAGLTCQDPVYNA